MSIQGRRSKEEHLARVRKNQQKCRERKRARVTELEQQVQELKSQVQDCQLCPMVPAHRRERQVEEMLQENAALRRLLNAMGIDEYCQRRYLESSTKREAIDLTLRRQGREVGPDPLSSENDTETCHGVRTYAMATMQQTNWSFRNPADTELGHGETDNLNIDPSQLGLNASPTGSYRILNDVSSYFGSWPSDPNNDESTPAGAIEPVEDMVNPQTSQVGALSSQDLTVSTRLSSEAGWNTEYETTACCPMDAAAPLSDSESTTVCSVALSMVFQHNRKHLTLNELNEKLRFGFRKALEPTQECRVENRVLFEVLAEIST